MSVRTPDPDPEPDDGLEGFGSAQPSRDSNPGWLSEYELAEARRHLPMLYVEAIPVRTDGSGQVTEIGIPVSYTHLTLPTSDLV